MFTDKLVFLGKGKSRTAYWDPDKKLVIKVPNNAYQLVYNELEWDIWNMIKGSPYEPYLCPCVDYDPKTSNLWCEYTEDVTPEEMLEAPRAEFMDSYIRNFGRYEGRIVIRDYPDLKKEKILLPEYWSTFPESYMHNFEFDQKHFDRNGLKRSKEDNALLPKLFRALENGIKQISAYSSSLYNAY